MVRRTAKEDRTVNLEPENFCLSFNGKPSPYPRQSMPLSEHTTTIPQPPQIQGSMPACLQQATRNRPLLRFLYHSTTTPGLLALFIACACMVCVTGRSQDSPAPQPNPLTGLTYDAPFFPNAQHDPNVPTPDSVLGFPVGSRPATHAQIEAVLKAVSARSPRCKLVEYGRTHEGRALYYVVIASESNLARLDSLKADLAKLADPRQVPKEDGDRLAETLPAVAWMAYAIHGDEMSGADASSALLYHLAADTDPEVTNLLANLIVIIDPLMNPDGRDRFLTMQAQNRTVQPSVDDQSLLHSGVWPSGRMNHYLFDMNRDWIFATQPETRGRLRAVNEWNPQYFMESHEMGPQDTFLFLPGREAINPNQPDNVRKWENEFAKDQAAAFDARGWRYYNGEWNDDWYPGYSSSWSELRGAVANLYEQAGIGTDAVRRPEGTLEPYREAVHKQLVSSMANLSFLARNRQAVLADFLAEKRKCVGPGASVPAHTFAIPPTINDARLHRFLDLMALEGFEVYSAGAAFTAQTKDRLGRDVKDRKFPSGTLLIPTRQPLARLLNAMLEFDPHTVPQFLTDERRDLLRFGRTRIYDITGWSVPMLFDLETFEIPSGLPAEAQASLGSSSRLAPLAITNADTSVAFVLDGADDASVVAAGRLMERGVWVRVADKPFQFDQHDFSRGSVLITRKDNLNFSGDLTSTVSNVCAEVKITAIGVRSGLGPGDLPDLGGEHFVLLKLPRIVMLGREPIDPYSYGSAWHLIDHVLGLRASYLDMHGLPSADLRRYNVLVIPDGADTDALKDRLEALKGWVTAGGTLLAIGSSAAALARATNGLGATRQLPDVLGKLDDYRQAVVREWEARQTTPDPEKVWSFSPPAEVVYPWLIGETDDKPKEEDLKRRDSWRAIFMPQGTVLAGRVDDRSWLTAGCGDYVPLIYSGKTVLLAPPTVQTPVRLGVFNPAPAKKPAETSTTADSKDKKKEETKPPPGWTIAPPGYELRLRMSGLLWPEAADRLANGAYVTRESIGSGQLILFAADPTFRAAALGTSRIFANAIIYGPGMGANEPIKP
jgi:hypothetical protein